MSATLRSVATTPSGARLRLVDPSDLAGDRRADRGSDPASGATLGGLLHDSRCLVQDAAQRLATTRLPSRPAAFAAVMALSDALRSCTELLDAVWGTRSQHDDVQVGANAQLVRSARQLQGLLAPYGRRPAALVGPDHDPTSALELLWRSTSRTVRCAADLVRTHREADGSWRCPESAALQDTGEILGLVGVVAHLVRLLAGCCTELTRQTRAFGVGPAMLRRHLGEPGELMRVAGLCTQVLPPLGRALARLGLARPSVRADLSPGQVAGRLARLRRTAWVLSRQAYVPAGTLADYADLAVALQDWDVIAGSRVGPGAAYRAWHDLQRDLTALRTASPALGGIRGDVALVRQALARPMAGAAVVAAVRGSVRALPELARWNAQSLARAASADQMYIRAAALSGEEVSDRPELVCAKLADRIVPVPYDRLVQIGAAYARAAGD